jgi:RNA polymerase sigma-70 factor, ECF subfamily
MILALGTKNAMSQAATRSEIRVEENAPERNGGLREMATAIASLDGFRFQPAITSEAHGISGGAAPERRREFASILSHSLPRFRRLAMRWLRNPEDAEDAVQDAMLSASRHIAQFDGRAQMSTWLTAIVINAVRMQLRRRPRCQVMSLDHSPAQGEWTISEVISDPGPTPERTAEQRELFDLVMELAKKLPPSQRAALQLTQWEGLSIPNTAKALGVPEGTVKARLARGRAELRRRFHIAAGTRGSRRSESDLQRQTESVACRM